MCVHKKIVHVDLLTHNSKSTFFLILFIHQYDKILGVFVLQSFVNMINSKKYNYDSKFQELLGKLDELMNLSVKAKGRENPECFISYCWKNSAQAVELGTR
jgi:hypothetical protein